MIRMESLEGRTLMTATVEFNPAPPGVPADKLGNEVARLSAIFIHNGGGVAPVAQSAPGARADLIQYFLSTSDHGPG